VVTAPAVEGAGVSAGVEAESEGAGADGVSLADPDQTEEYPTLELAGKTLLGLGAPGREGELAAAGVVSVTGQTVVETAMVEVTTVVESAGQLVTLAAQLVMVILLVVYTVEVVH
jgi:hypothetical protein